MANHATVRLPWAVPKQIMNLFARSMMEAAFGGYYVPLRDENGGEIQAGDTDDSFCLEFEQKVRPESGWSLTTQIWSESLQHIEMRHGCSGLDRVAQALEFEGLCACFGAPVAYDEGIGEYLLDRPGRISLLPMRGLCDGLSPSSASEGYALIRKILSRGEPSPDSKESLETLWMLSPKQQLEAEPCLDPLFFNPPNLDATRGERARSNEEYLRLQEKDAVDWGNKLDWAHLIDSRTASGERMDAKSAAAALLPSAALNKPCPESALARASVQGLERALAVALMWSSASTAQQIHQRLCTASTHAKASESKAKEMCDKFLAKRDKTREGRAVAHQKESAQALHESLVLSREAAQAGSPKGAVKNKSFF